MSGICIILHQFLLVVEFNSQFIKIEYCNDNRSGLREENNGTVGFLGSNFQRYPGKWKLVLNLASFTGFAQEFYRHNYDAFFH